MIKDLIQVIIYGKTFVPIDDLIKDLGKHLYYEIKDIPEEDKDGYEWATYDALIHLRNYL